MHEGSLFPDWGLLYPHWENRVSIGIKVYPNWDSTVDIDSHSIAIITNKHNKIVKHNGKIKMGVGYKVKTNKYLSSESNVLYFCKVFIF